MPRIFDTSVLSTNEFYDFDQMAGMAATAWDQHYRKLTKGPDYGFAQQLNVQEAQLTYIGWKAGLHIETGTPQGSIAFVQQVTGDGQTRFNGKTLASNEIKVMHSPHEYDLVAAANTTYMVLAVSAERVRRHIEALWGDDVLTRTDSLDSIITTTPVQQKLHKMIRYHLELGYAKPNALSDPVVQELMIDELLDAVFLSSRMLNSKKRVVKRHILAKKAAQFLQYNVDKVVTLSALCEHVGASERSLRQGFLERFGITPKVYIKRYRLYQLHEQLRNSSFDNQTITQTALRLGLTHLGRLPAEYRELFGELPSETLAGTDD